MTARTPARAVFFDVDFTLIHPGPAFQGGGYQTFCAEYGILVDPAAFERAVFAAAPLLETPAGVYDPQVFIAYTRRIIEEMGGSGPDLDRAAWTIYEEWAACRHFALYEDVPDVLRLLRGAGVTIGLISNTHRSLQAFEEHFDLRGLFAVAVSSSEHGYMKPHPSIFRSALEAAAVHASDAVMVGDSLAHDIAGARGLGMRGVLVSRHGTPPDVPPDVPVIHSLRELPALL